MRGLPLPSAVVTIAFFAAAFFFFSSSSFDASVVHCLCYLFI
jgi:hypothetical protein